MDRTFSTLLIVLLIFGTTGGVFTGPLGQQTCAQEVSFDAASGEQLVVLKNGSVIAGFVEQHGQQVAVQTRQGSRLVIAAEDSDFVCRSMVDAYWGKLARTKAGDVAGQIGLFRWCLRYQLLDQAQNQIDVLQVTHIAAQELNFLNRQLAVAFEQADSRRPLANGSDQIPAAKLRSAPDAYASTGVEGPLATIKPEAAPDFFDEQDPVFESLPALGSSLESSLDSSLATGNPPGDWVFPSDEVRQVGYAEPIVDATEFEPMTTETEAISPEPVETESIETEAISPEPVITANQLVSTAELDALTRSMPTGSLAIFKQRIETVFVSQCSSCHSSGSEFMPLMHAGKTRKIPRRMSQRNLHSILQVANSQNPLASPVLSAATTAHGGAEQPGMELESQEYLNLKKWLVMVSDQPKRHDPFNHQSQVKAVQNMASQNMANQNMANQNMASQNMASQTVTPVEPQPDTNRFGADSIKRLKSGSPVTNDPLLPRLAPTIGEIPQLDAKEPVFQPRDEFDPEIFNRQFAE